MEFLKAFPVAIIDEDYEGKQAAGRGMRQLAEAIESGGESVRHRIEALGGVLSTRSHSDQQVSVVASFWIAEGSERQ